MSDTFVAKRNYAMTVLEAKATRLAYIADLRMTLTEQRQDLLCKVLVKLTKPRK